MKEKKFQEDFEIAIAIKNNDDEAFTRMYDKYSKNIYTCIRKFAIDDHEAQDILQETFIRILNYFRKGHTLRSNLAGLLYTCAYCVSVEHTRKRKQNRYIDITPFTTNIQVSTDPQVDYDLKEKVGVFNTFLKKSSTGMAKITSLYFEGYTHNEIAKLFGITEGTSKGQLARMRGKMKELHKYIETKD